MAVCNNMLTVRCPLCLTAPCTCQTLTRSRSYHGDRHRRSQNTRSALLNGTETRVTEARRNSLPKCLKLVLLDPGSKLPTLNEPSTPSSPSGWSEDERRLRTKLQQLLKAMLSLRQVDIALLKQLWSLSDQLYDLNGETCSASSSSLSRSMDRITYPSLSSLDSRPSLESREECYSSHESFEYDESEATSIPIMHLDPS